MLDPDRYLLFVEDNSRYDNEIRTLLPVESPDDGLQRVLIDHEHAARLDPDALSHPRTEEQRIAFLRADSPFRRYSRTIGLSAAELLKAQRHHSSGRLWCIGEMTRRYATVLPQAAGIEMVQLRVSILSSLVAFSLPPETVTPDLILPFFVNDYGARLFAFDREGTELENRLAELYDIMRRDTGTTDEEWRRGDWERTVRRALAEKGEILTYDDDAERPPSAREIAERWQKLQDDCWFRDNLRELLNDALFCVLPDGKHDGAVAFHSVTVPNKVTVDTVCRVVREQGGSTSIIALIDD
jgi:hypothetical protein